MLVYRKIEQKELIESAPSRVLFSFYKKQALMDALAIFYQFFSLFRYFFLTRAIPAVEGMARVKYLVYKINQKGEIREMLSRTAEHVI